MGCQCFKHNQRTRSVNSQSIVIQTYRNTAYHSWLYLGFPGNVDSDDLAGI